MSRADDAEIEYGFTKTYPACEHRPNAMLINTTPCESCMNDVTASNSRQFVDPRPGHPRSDRVDPHNWKLTSMSQWIDDANAHRNSEAITWGRLAKVSEECGEVIEAFIGHTGQNPRKGVCKSAQDVQKELLDTAVTALCAWEHMTGNMGGSFDAMREHIDFLFERMSRVRNTT